MVFITVLGSVYSAVRTDSLYKAHYFSSLKCSEDNAEEYGRPGQDRDENMEHAHCMLDT